MPAVAIPAIAGVGGGIFNYLSANRASQLSPAEKTAQQTQQSAASGLAGQGSALSQFGMPKLQQAGNYFSTLAGGNRAAVGQALAPDAANINATYGGTQRTLNRFLRGPERDQQTGELARQRAGAIGSLFTGARAQGVAGLTSLGQYGVQQGQAGLAGAASIAGNVGSQAMSNRYAGADLQRQAGSDSAGFLFQLLKSGAWNPSKATPSGSPWAGPSPATTPGFGGFPLIGSAGGG